MTTRGACRLSAALLLAFHLAAPGDAAPRRRSARPARPVPTPGRLSPGERISLDLKDADIRDVLRSFASMGGVNVVIDPDVKGSVTVRLHDVTWENALDVILRSNGLGMVTEGRVVRIGAPAKLAGENSR